MMNTLDKTWNMNSSNLPISKNFNSRKQWINTYKMMKTKVKMKCKPLIKKLKKVCRLMMRITIRLRQREPSIQLKNEILKCKEFYNKQLQLMLPNKLTIIHNSSNRILKISKRRDISKWRAVSDSWTKKV